MQRVFGLVVAGGIVFGLASTAGAQVGVSIGNPYTGQGITIGTPGYYGGYGSPYTNTYSSFYGAPMAGTYNANPGYAGYANPGMSYYGSGYSGYANPGTTYYGTGYSGYANPGTTYYGTGYYGGVPAGSMYNYSSPVYGYGTTYAPYSYSYGRRGLLRGWRR